MNYLIVGAGNAGRPVARFLNFKENNVTITDPKEFEEFRYDVQNILLKMEKEGVKLDLGNKNPSLDGFEKVYKAPSLPESAPIAVKIKEEGIPVLTNEEFSKMVDAEIPCDIIGITGTLGKTTTTYLITSLFKEAGYKVWSCCSLARNLVSETIIDGLVKGKAKDCDICILELPHGTLGLLDRLTIKIGILTYLGKDHLNEFGGSLEKYHERKMFLEKMSETFITHNRFREKVENIREDTVYYAIDEECDFVGEIGENSLTIKYDSKEFTTPFYMMSYFFEDAAGAAAVALKYGIEEETIIKALTEFKGLPSHMQDLGDWNGRRVIIDSAFLYDGIKTTLEFFKDKEVVVFLDNFDTSDIRNKKEVGQLVEQYCYVVIASGFSEAFQRDEMHIAYEVLDAITKEDVVKVAAKDLEEAAYLSLKYSKPGDIILHIGPELPFDRVGVMNKIQKGIKRGSEDFD